MRVAVLCGGRSHERTVSLRSGARVEQALLHLGHEPVLVDTEEHVEQLLRDGGFDVAFIALHGRGEEDGGIQALLGALGIPYTGSRSTPCAAAYDKARAKRLLVAANVPTPRFVTFSEGSIEEQGAMGALAEARETIGYPLVVKPARSGSSLGTRFVEDEEAMPRALLGAMSYDVHVVVETHVSGRELAVTLLGGGDSEVRVLPAVEIVPRNADWFDYESRYAHGETEFTCPPEGFPPAVLDRVAEVALAAYEALDCSGFGRVDMIIDDAGDPWVLEVATAPGLTETSLVPLACEAAGIALPRLVELLLADALAQSVAD
ncbi:MAG: D-alanine--D-alanine ligase [Thermoleophilia bacterium]|nr:D-alanine--D-alanine ligase [Thermoleophilia bacterium]